MTLVDKVIFKVLQITVILNIITTFTQDTKTMIIFITCISLK